MLKWMLLHDALFHAGRKGGKSEWITLKKGSIYDEVPVCNQIPEVINAVKKNRQRAKYNTEYVVLFAEGVQRVLIIGEDVTRHISSSTRFKRIRRCKPQ